MRLFAPALIFCGAIASFGQSPQVPHKMQFAGMTLTIRDDARREIQTDVDALTRSPKYFNIKAERAKTYFPIIEEIFAEERLPLDFKYLALQESALVPDAVSSSNAVGFWQFKDFTATEVGMRVDGEVDERKNIASASRGAARYLKQCNHYFNNWIYALQSYQMGAGGVMRLVGDKDLGSRHMEINTDTYWYVKKFLAHKVAFEQVTGSPALEVSVVRDAGGKTLAELAQETSVDENSLKEMNKWLKSDRIPVDKPYVVLVPKGSMGPEFSTLSVAAVKPAPLGGGVSTGTSPGEVNGIPVIYGKSGETLSDLVARAGISLSRFLNYNEMDIDHPIRAGAWYFLEKKKKHALQEVYTASPGEDLWAVSQRFGVRMKYLMKYNDIKEASRKVEGASVYLSYHRPVGVVSGPDSVIVLLDTQDTFEWDISLAPTGATALSASAVSDVAGTPASVAATVPATSTVAVSAPAYHEVKPSDTLYSVARQYGVTIREIMEWNGKRDFGLAVGEKLRVAGR
jgi:membrane-bound lytic murein transglycosylase D